MSSLHRGQRRRRKHVGKHPGGGCCGRRSRSDAFGAFVAPVAAAVAAVNATASAAASMASATFAGAVTSQGVEDGPDALGRLLVVGRCHVLEAVRVVKHLKTEGHQY